MSLGAISSVSNNNASGIVGGSGVNSISVGMLTTGIVGVGGTVMLPNSSSSSSSSSTSSSLAQTHLQILANSNGNGSSISTINGNTQHAQQTVIGSILGSSNNGGGIVATTASIQQLSPQAPPTYVNL
ncbi:hypothetical protein KR215_009584 [Drosophila sulfurigaster]|nr:hypothetical protein KR215_009584 [Drosophila sulfurigaster]